MWCSTNKDNGTLRLVKRNTTSFLHLKKRRHLNMFSKSSPININHSRRHFAISWEWKGYVTHNLYDQTKRLDSITLFCLFADCEPVDFEEARKTKDREIQWTKKLDPSRRTTHGNSSPLKKGKRLLVSSGCTKQRRMPKEKLKDIRQD